MIAFAMSGNRTHIDKSEWQRREIFDFFSGIAYPFYSVCFNIEVTGLYSFVKREGLSFYHAMIYLCTRAVNQTEAFLYCAEGEEIYLLERRLQSFTHLAKGEELFRIITMPCEGGIRDFCRAAAEKCAGQSAFINKEAEGDDLIYISCLPWIDMTALTNEHDVGTEEAKLDSVPRIAWGRIKDEGGRKKVNFSVLYSMAKPSHQSNQEEYPN